MTPTLRHSFGVFLLCLLPLLGCGGDEERGRLPAAALLAGAAEGTVDLPIGLPLSGFVNADRNIFPFAAQPLDERERPYTNIMVPSTGVHTRITVKVLALAAGGEEVVVVKSDLIFAFAAITEALEERLSAATGRSFENRVIFTTNHSHNSYGDFTQDVALEVGTDTYRQEVFDRMAARMTEVALSALEEMRPARIGIGIDENFDPEDEIFRDRREENDIFDAEGNFFFTDPACAENFTPACRVETEAPGRRGKTKDNRLSLIRVDDATRGETIALLVNFGIHGTVLGSAPTKLHRDEPGPGNLLVSVEAPGMVEQKTEKRFAHPVVVMHVQGSAGDVSPAGDKNGHRDFQAMEVIGEIAAEKIMRLFHEMKTAEEVGLEVLTRAVFQSREEIRVTRGGEVDYSYPAVTDPLACDGNPLTFEDFNFPFGAALCGEETGARIDERGCVVVYKSCVGATGLAVLLQAVDPNHTELPLPGTEFTLISTLRLSGVPVTRETGRAEREDMLIAALPGEPISIYTERLRERAKDLGFDDAIVFGYSQDHEGYLLTVEDWLSGGMVEVQVNVWGPLQMEHIMDQALELAHLLRTPEREDPEAGFPDPVIPARSLSDPLQEPVRPEETPRAGEITSQPLPQVERLGFVTFTFLGGDPAIDLPRVTLERQEGERWETFLRFDGRPLDDSGYEIVMTYRPDPLSGEGRDHLYTVHFEVVTDEPDINSFAGFPVGTYRFRIEGMAADPGDTEFPFSGRLYTSMTDPFAIIPTDDLGIEVAGTSSGEISGRVTYPAAAGFRLRDPKTPPDLPSPVRGGTVWVEIMGLEGPVQEVTGSIRPDGTFVLAKIEPSFIVLHAEDSFGNRGELQL